MNENEENELLTELARKVTDEVQNKDADPLGFTRVVDFLSSMKKPLIVHNGLMDLLFLYDKFYGPLPEEVDAFTAAINKVFPLIFDTKHMLNVRLQL